MSTLRHLLTVLAVGISFNASAAEFKSCPHFFANGVAPILSASSPGNQRELCFDAFAVLHSGQSKTPVYVAERLNRAQLLDAEGEERTDKFYEEARLPRADRARLEDYKSRLKVGDSELKFDRGHLAPAGDMPNAQAMAQSFSLSNMIPQAPQNNRGPWKGYEKATRKYAMRALGDVYVISGPVYSGPVQALGPNQVWVPKYIYKLVYDAASGRSWAYWIENTNTARAERPITYQELVKRTGIEFLPGVKAMSDL